MKEALPYEVNEELGKVDDVMTNSGVNSHLEDIKKAYKIIAKKHECNK